MEQCEQSLIDLIETRKEENLSPYPVEYITKVAVDIAKALEYLHSSLVLHGDIKSGNVLVKSKSVYVLYLLLLSRYVHNYEAYIKKTFY